MLTQRSKSFQRHLGKHVTNILLILTTITLFGSINVAAQEKNKKSSPSKIESSRAALLQEAAQVLEDEYIYKDIGINLANYLRENRTMYDDIENVEQFTEAVTNDLFKIAKDKHLSIFVRPFKPKKQGQDSKDKISKPLSYCRSAQVEYKMLNKYIGYIQFPWFKASKGHVANFDRAMTELKNTKGLILDLRGNCGGTEEEVRHLSTYFFREPTHLVNSEGRREPVSERWTLENVPGPRYLGKPVYILADKETFSAAESFIFGLKALNRVTIVGERTGGGGHYGGMARLSPDVVIFVPVGRTFDPRTNASWESNGIVPDIEVSSEKSLETALNALVATLK